MQDHSFTPEAKSCTNSTHQHMFARNLRGRHQFWFQVSDPYFNKKLRIHAQTQKFLEAWTLNFCQPSFTVSSFWLESCPRPCPTSSNGEWHGLFCATSKLFGEPFSERPSLSQQRGKPLAKSQWSQRFSLRKRIQQSYNRKLVIIFHCTYEWCSLLHPQDFGVHCCM